MNPKYLLSQLFVVFALFFHTGYSRTVTGNVSQIGGGIIAGASVTAKEVSSVFTLTDTEGNFTIDLPEEVKHLIFTYSHMETQEIEMGNQTKFDVVLIPLNFTKFRIGFGLSLGGAKTTVSSPENAANDTAVEVKLTPFSLHADFSYNFNKKFNLQSILEADFNALKYTNEATGASETGILKRMIFSVMFNYNQRFNHTARSSVFLGIGPQFQNFSVFNTSTVGFRLQTGISLNNYGFNTKIYFAVDVANGKINGLQDVEGYKFSYVSSRLGILFNF